MSTFVSLSEYRTSILNDQMVVIHIPRDLFPFFTDAILKILHHEVCPQQSAESPTKSPMESQSGEKFSLSGLDHALSEIETDDNQEQSGKINVHQETDQSQVQQDPVDRSMPVWMNFTLTPMECTVICTREMAEWYFKALIDKFNECQPNLADKPSISEDDFIIMDMRGMGHAPSQSALEVAAPIIMAGVPMYLMTTQVTDFVLFPTYCKPKVVAQLRELGFRISIYEDDEHRIPSALSYENCDPGAGKRSRFIPVPPCLAEMEKRAVACMRENNVVPTIDKSMRMVFTLVAAPEGAPVNSSMALIREMLITVLTVDKPQFLSLTWTTTDRAICLGIEERLKPRFEIGPNPHSTQTNYLGSNLDIYYPVVLDMRGHTTDITGVAEGVASIVSYAVNRQIVIAPSPKQPLVACLSRSRLPQPGVGYAEHRVAMGRSLPTIVALHLGKLVKRPVDILFLNTANVGIVLVGEYELGRVISALEDKIFPPEDENIEEQAQEPEV